MDSGRETVGERGELRRKFVERELCLAPGRPGVQPITVPGAVFEYWSYSGYVFVDMYAIRNSILPAGHNSMGWKWWDKKKLSMESSARKYELGNASLRLAMPIGRNGRAETDGDRCLTYPSLSVRLLLVTLLKSCHTTSKQKGMVVEDDVRQALSTLLDRMLHHLPTDHGYLHWGAGWA